MFKVFENGELINPRRFPPMSNLKMLGNLAYPDNCFNTLYEASIFIRHVYDDSAPRQKVMEVNKSYKCGLNIVEIRQADKSE